MLSEAVQLALISTVGAVVTVVLAWDSRRRERRVTRRVARVKKLIVPVEDVVKIVHAAIAVAPVRPAPGGMHQHRRGSDVDVTEHARRADDPLGRDGEP